MQALSGDPRQRDAVSMGPIWHACITIRPAKHRYRFSTKKEICKVSELIKNGQIEWKWPCKLKNASTASTGKLLKLIQWVFCIFMKLSLLGLTSRRFLYNNVNMHAGMCIHKERWREAYADILALTTHKHTSINNFLSKSKSEFSYTLYWKGRTINI